MAVNREVMRMPIKGRWQSALAKLALASVFLLWLQNVGVVEAAPSAPILGESDWRTGELMVNWSNVTPGNTIMIYAKTYTDNGYHVVDVWKADTSSGSYIVKPFENGQTVWHYIVQVDPLTGEVSPPSNEGKQTPPITAYIINWPDMFKDLQTALDGIKQAISDANQSMQNYLTQQFTPSSAAMGNMQSAVDGLKNSVGAGSASNVGSSLQSSFTDVKSGLKSPVVHDDGNGTFTGGSEPTKLPGLEGTPTEMTMCIPLTYDKFHGDKPMNVCLFTREQLDKMKWWDLVRQLIGYTIYITFGVWVVTRFTPQFKV